MPTDEWDREIPADEQLREVAKILAVALIRFRECPPVVSEAESRPAPAPEAIPPLPTPTPSKPQKPRRKAHKPTPDEITRPQTHGTQEFDTTVFIHSKALQVCRWRGFTPSDLEDLCQEMHLHLLSKAHLFDPTRGPMAAFATTVLNSWIGMLLRHRNRKRRRRERDAVSLERFRVEVGGVRRKIVNLIPDGSADPIERIDVREALEHVIRRCSNHEREVLLLVLERGVAAAARTRMVSSRQIYSDMRRIRRYFEEAGWGVS